MKNKKAVIIVVAAILVCLALLYHCVPIESPMPLWLSVLPPIIAIVMALFLKEVISALFLGVLSGTFIMALFNGQEPGTALGSGLLRVVDTYITGSLFDFDHVTIIVYTLTIGGMVKIISANRGMQGIVNWLLRRAKGPRSGQIMKDRS